MSRHFENDRALVLISDGYTEGLENYNSRSQFLNKFPIDVDCQSSQFEIALTKIKFSNSIYNLPKGEVHNIGIFSEEHDAELNIQLNPGYYSISDILACINQKIEDISFELDLTSKKVVAKSERTGASKIRFSHTLSVLLGFERYSEFEIAAGAKIIAPAVYNDNPNDQIYIYCSMVCAEHIVGGTLTNLLSSCPINSKTFNECVVYEPRHLIYLPVKRQHFLYSTIYITNHLGQQVIFERGSVEIHVKLRRVSPFL